MDYASAFNIADYHVAEENFFSKWIPLYYESSEAQDAKLDDNGDKIGSDGSYINPLPNNGDGFLAGMTGI